MCSGLSLQLCLPHTPLSNTQLEYFHTHPLTAAQTCSMLKPPGLEAVEHWEGSERKLRWAAG